MDTLSLARSKLVLEQPFFGTLALYLTPQEDSTVPTAATDGRRLLYNPEWIEYIQNKHSIRAVMGIIAHEVLHCALGHIWRRESRDPLIWNIAADFATNLIVTGSGLPLPDEALINHDYRDKSAEEIYSLLIQNVDYISGMATLDDHSKWFQSRVANHGSDIADEWRDKLVTAAEACKSQGRLPASIQRLVDDILQPKVNYKQLLAEYMQKIMDEYVWGPFDRRHIHSGTYIPSVFGEGLREVIVAIDTSGSISQNEINQFLAETIAIASIGIVQLHVVFCDAEVHGWITVEDAVLPKLDLRGGGGTSFIPVFDEIKKRGIEPAVLIYLTDGYGDYPASPPDYPVLWVLTKDHLNPPFGRAVILD